MKIAVFFLLAFLLLQPVLGANLGVSPGRMSFKDMLRGGYAEQILVVTTSSDKGLVADLTVSGEIVDWISFEDGKTSFELDEKKPTEIRVIAQPPENVPNGVYSGRIKVLTSELDPARLQGFGATVRVAVDVLVTVEITDEEFFGCRASGFGVKSVEKGSPLFFTVSVINEGNTKLKPRLTARVWDASQEKIVDSFDFEGAEILPTLKKEMQFEVPTHSYGYGQHWVDLEVPDCFAQDTLTFDILEKGSLQAEGVIERIEGKVWAFTDEVIPIVVFFRNTGQKDVIASFKGDVKLGDRVVKVLETDEEVVRPGELAELVSYFSPKEEGRYVARGRVFYEKKRTFEVGTVINVTQKEEDLELSWVVYAIIAAAVLLLLLIRRERRRYRRKIWW